MSALTIHPIEYLKVHLHYEETRARVQTWLGSVAKKVFNSSEQAATIAVALLTVGLLVFACMKVTEAALVAASFDAAITEIFPSSLQFSPDIWKEGCCMF